MRLIVLSLALLCFPSDCCSSIMNQVKSRPVVIVGGGPVGLGMALMLDKRGFESITVIEKRPKDMSFEREKSYLYLLDSRGQRLLSDLGLLDQLAERGVPSSTFRTLTEVRTDGSLHVKSLPVIPLSAKNKEKYWIPRSGLLTLLEAQARTRPSIKLLFDHSIESIAYSDADDCFTLSCSGGSDNGRHTHKTKLLLGCDGYRSGVRRFLGKDFTPISLNSDSAGLQYKMLTPKLSFPLPDGSISQPGTAYAIRSTGSTATTRVSLGLLPVKADSPRTANIIAPPTHEIWSLRTGPEVWGFLRKSFPQLDPLDAFVDPSEVLQFAEAAAGSFPKPSHVERCIAVMGASNSSFAALAGDAVHFFPPDLGQGVNSGLEDVSAMSACLERWDAALALQQRQQSRQQPHQPSQQQPSLKPSALLAAALREYESDRVKEAAAIAKIMVYGYPYQYRQAPWKGRLCLLNFALRLALNKIAPALFHPPAFFMVQQDGRSYFEINKLAQRTTRAIAKTALVLVALVLGRHWLAAKATVLASFFSAVRGGGGGLLL